MTDSLLLSSRVRRSTSLKILTQVGLARASDIRTGTRRRGIDDFAGEKASTAYVDGIISDGGDAGDSR